jgi:hypothetical protein
MAKARKVYREQSEVKRRCKMYLEAHMRHATTRQATDATWYALLPRVDVGPDARINAAEPTP